MSTTRHHLPLVTVQRHDGKVKVCPHCQKEVTPGSIYKDAKGWCFHRPCFAKGKGSIDLEKSGSLPLRLALGTALGGTVGASKLIPKINPWTGAAIGAGTALLSDYIVPTVSPAEADPMSKLPEERRRLLSDKFKNITDTLGREGTYTGTWHKRVVVPHEYMEPQDLQDLGFLRSRIAVPERGQVEFTTWRHPHNLYHFHNHPSGLTVHEDFFPSMDMLRYGARHPIDRLLRDIPKGVSHAIVEGVPGYANYLSNRFKDLFKSDDHEEVKEVTPGGRKPRGIIRSILRENPNALVKMNAAPVVHEKQINDFNCGPAALKAVENSMGVGHPDQQTYQAETAADTDNGTPVVNLEQTAANHGLQLDSHDQMDINELQQKTQGGKPVIVAVQLDGQDGGPKSGWNSGHYVVVKDVSNGQVRFMDPNSDQPERVWPVDEFISRWHDHDHNGKVYNQWGMSLYRPDEVKQGADGSLGSGAGQSQSTVPPQMMDASGATPAGHTDMQPASDETARQQYLDCCEQDPDPQVFDTNVLEKSAISSKMIARTFSSALDRGISPERTSRFAKRIESWAPGAERRAIASMNTVDAAHPLTNAFNPTTASNIFKALGGSKTVYPEGLELIKAPLGQGMAYPSGKVEYSSHVPTALHELGHMATHGHADPITKAPPRNKILHTNNDIMLQEWASNRRMLDPKTHVGLSSVIGQEMPAARTLRNWTKSEMEGYRIPMLADLVKKYPKYLNQQIPEFFPGALRGLARRLVGQAAKTAGALDEAMSVGTEETQEPLDNTMAQWTGNDSHATEHTTGWKNRLLAMVSRASSYQDSGTSEAGGRAFAQSSPTFQSGASIQQQAGLSAQPGTEADTPPMQLDSDTISTGQPKHLNA